jgi:hypothetical protein
MVAEIVRYSLVINLSLTRNLKWSKGEFLRIQET